MNPNINFLFEDAAYINTIPGVYTSSETEGMEGKTYEFTLMEKMEPTKPANRYKIKWFEDIKPSDFADIEKEIVKSYKAIEAE